MTVASPIALPELAPLTPALLHALLAARAEPSVSIYLPTRRSSPPDELNRIVLKGLVADAAAALASRTEPATVDRLLAPVHELMASPLLLAPPHDGLAMFASEGICRLVAVDGPLEPEAVVAPRFHVLPLISRLAAIEHCLVVTISERVVRACIGQVSAYGGDRLFPLPLPLPHGGHAASGELFREQFVEEEPSQPHRVFHGGGTFGGARVHGGFGARTDGFDTDTGHFLREAARIVAQAPGWDADWPLVTVALPQVASLFAPLAAHGPAEQMRVDRDPAGLTDAELAACAGVALRAGRLRRRAQLLDAFRAARAHGRGSGDLAEIARAAVAGQVATLIVEAGRREAGKIDRTTGSLVPCPAATAVRRPGSRREAGGEDLYEDLVEIVVEHGGAIVPLARIQMPTESGVAAIYRYATS
jgi:hypothetical protein